MSEEQLIELLAEQLYGYAEYRHEWRETSERNKQRWRREARLVLRFIREHDPVRAVKGERE